MKLNSKISSACQASLTIFLIAVLSSCGTRSSLPSPTSIPPQPTRAERETVSDPSSLFRTGLSYSDASGDIAVSFLDVVAF